MSPVCSVIMPAYNCEKYIGAAIDSVLGQTFTDLEIIVVDDCSPDGCSDKVHQYMENDKRVRYIRHKQNKGVAEARNTGVNMASGEYIAFLDSDDVWLPDKLAKQMQMLQESASVLCYTGARFIDDDGRDLQKNIDIPVTVNYESILHGNVVVCSSVLVKRDVLLEYPMERSDLQEDYITWLRILKAYGQGCGINEPLVYYRLAKGSKSRSKINSAMMTWKTYRYIGLGLYESIQCFAGYVRHGIKRYYGSK